MTHGTIRAATLKDVIPMIMRQYNCDENHALKLFYESHIGACYSDDETGLYGQSALYIFSLFMEQKIMEQKMPYLARKDQAVADHLKEVSLLAKKFGETFHAENIAYVVGLLHDFGKYTQAFQDYLKDGIEGEKVRRGEVIHALQGAKYILETIKEPLVAEIIANIIGTHHGGLYDGVYDGKKPIIEKIKNENLDYDKAKSAFLSENQLPENIIQLCENEIRAMCKQCASAKLEVRFMLHLWTKAIYSCLVDADRFDAAGFDIESEIHRDVPKWSEYSEQLNKFLANIKSNATDDIKNIRKIISNQCEHEGERRQGIFTLSVPTGGGKTLSSLRFALKHAEEHGLKRIIYVIPYLSILDQTAKNIRKALAESETDDAYRQTDEFILEHHSNLEIPEKENEDEQDNAEKKYKLLTSRWDSPIILTTMVQFLETIYSNKASRLRKFHNMANSVIIFDEIQALPIKCVHLFNEAVNFLYTFGKSTALLCTATQPHLNKVKRPILLSANPNIVSVSHEEAKYFERVVVIDKTRQEGWTIEEIAELTKSQLDSGKSTLVILNTKAEAKELYEKCKQFDCEKAFLTTNLCPAHRMEILERLRDNLDNHRLTLCISTQLIEAGVDVSFDCVIRAKAGLDSIVQGAGRCNRNGESPILQEVYVVNIKDEELSGLPEIEDGKKATRRIFRDMKGKNFLGEEAMEWYYKCYFCSQQKDDKSKLNKMDYITKNEKDTIYNLLSQNIYGVKAYKSQNDLPYHGLPCAFKTAAEEFSVIDEGQIGIVVPYGEATELVKQFRGTYDPKEKSSILKKLQKYTVSVYPHTLQELRKAVIIIDGCFYFLEDDDYYDEEQGLLNTSRLSLKYV
jgi:CRISPR-associated endonuclease/helicase Cas3